jgi:hypothetical protein
MRHSRIRRPFPTLGQGAAMVSILGLALATGCADSTAPTLSDADMTGVIRSITVGDEVVLALDRTDPAAPANDSELPDALVAVKAETELLALSDGEPVPVEVSNLHPGDAVEVWHTESEWLSIPPGYDAVRIVVTAEAAGR